eukprot:NODE_5022_length_1819_cov_2.933806.p1 GENE.NODE_5022_length_1819_cov_2.933806~~NODE_5022_length_1819_cov_2.933806.p1  ORF type:complete len:516 (+),score=107.26 NODE_5022_length_1819_cov_2.933806:69-1550(+)
MAGWRAQAEATEATASDVRRAVGRVEALERSQRRAVLSADAEVAAGAALLRIEALEAQLSSARSSVPSIAAAAATARANASEAPLPVDVPPAVAGNSPASIENLRRVAAMAAAESTETPEAQVPELRDVYSLEAQLIDQQGTLSDARAAGPPQERPPQASITERIVAARVEQFETSRAAALSLKVPLAVGPSSQVPPPLPQPLRQPSHTPGSASPGPPRPLSPRRLPPAPARQGNTPRQPTTSGVPVTPPVDSMSQSCPRVPSMTMPLTPPASEDDGAHSAVGSGAARSLAGDLPHSARRSTSPPPTWTSPLTVRRAVSTTIVSDQLSNSVGSSCPPLVVWWQDGGSSAAVSPGTSLLVPATAAPAAPAAPAVPTAPTVPALWPRLDPRSPLSSSRASVLPVDARALPPSSVGGSTKLPVRPSVGGAAAPSHSCRTISSAAVPVHPPPAMRACSPSRTHGSAVGSAVTPAQALQEHSARHVMRNLSPCKSSRR